MVFLLTSLLMENHEDSKLTTGLGALHFVVPAATVWDSGHHELGMQQACKDGVVQPRCRSVSSMVVQNIIGASADSVFPFASLACMF